MDNIHPDSTSSEELKRLIKENFKRCARDPQFFLTNFCFIQHPKKGKIKFDLYDYQSNTLDRFIEHDYNIILKGRQIGISTLVAGYALWLMLFHGDKNILVISKDQQTAKNLVTKVRVMNKMLPSWLKRKLEEDNKLTLRFFNGSQIQAVASTKDAGRSEALSLLVLDEAAFIDEADNIWKGASSAASSTGGKVIILSTPNGQGNFFHTMWNEAESGENGFFPTTLDWRVHPDRDQSWRDNQTKVMGELAAIQEHDASFIFSGNIVIHAKILEDYKEKICKDPIEKLELDKGLWVWEYPDLEKSYVVSADVGRGDGSDFSTFHVLDIDTMNQVAEYKGKIGTTEFGNLLVATATKYNDALLIPENTGIGWAVVQKIIDREYKQLFYMSKDMQVVDIDQQFSTKIYDEDKTLVPGFTTSAKTRPVIIARIDEYMRDMAIIIRSKRTISEFETFIWNNGKAEAMQGKNDDLIMALGIGIWVRDTALRLRNERRDRMMSAVDLFKLNALPFVRKSNPGEDAFTMKLPHGKEDLRWLL